MTYKELVKLSIDLPKMMAIKRANEVKDALREVMAIYGLTKEEMKSYLDGEDSINPANTQDEEDPTEVVVIPEMVESTPIEGEEPLALPESSQKGEEVPPIGEQVSINPENNVEKEVTSIWEHPNLTAPYNPMVVKEEVSTPEPEVTPVEKTEEELSSMEELLSDDPEYKEYYAPKHPEKKSDRTLPTMDELLSGEPINRILCLGNEVPDDKAYKQHYRISHVDGIIPTETATGQTIIYIPPVAA